MVLIVLVIIVMIIVVYKYKRENCRTTASPGMMDLIFTLVYHFFSIETQLTTISSDIQSIPEYVLTLPLDSSPEGIQEIAECVTHDWISCTLLKLTPEETRDIREKNENTVTKRYSIYRGRKLVTKVEMEI